MLTYLRIPLRRALKVRHGVCTGYRTSQDVWKGFEEEHLIVEVLSRKTNWVMVMLLSWMEEKLKTKKRSVCCLKIAV